MHSNNNNRTVDQAFFEPLRRALAGAVHTRNCPELSDRNWLHLGVQRVLEGSPSGRGFLQEHADRFHQAPTHDAYFASFHSKRRLALAREINAAIIKDLTPGLPNRLADLWELDRYECFAGDFHWHGAATHDPRHEGKKMAVGHLYSLNLRTHTLQHLATGEGLHESDATALKRAKPKGLRHGVPKGRRVIIVYDKAGIDLPFWKRCRQECAVYFLSMVKEGMVFDWGDSVAWDRQDTRNQGVLDDRRATTAGKQPVRVITYLDPRTNRYFEFMTNEPDLPPGVLAELYRRRWEIEKVFDEVKNHLGQKRAWGGSQEAREIQAHMILITHNLLLGYEWELEQRHGVMNRIEDQRRTKRDQEAAMECERIGDPMNPLALLARRATQRGVKFIRWLRCALAGRLAEAAAVPRLIYLYAKL